MAKKAAKKAAKIEELVRKLCEEMLGEKFDGIRSIRISKQVRLAEEPYGPYWSIKIEREMCD